MVLGQEDHVQTCTSILQLDMLAFLGSFIVLPVYCPTKENVSDIMTKPVSRPVLEYLRPRLLWPHEEPKSQDSVQSNDRSGASS